MPPAPILTISRAASRLSLGRPMPRLLLLIPTASYRTADYLAAAGRLGVDIAIAVATDGHQALAAHAEGRTVVVDFADLERGARQLATYARRYPVDCVVAVDGEGAVLAARVGELLGLPQNPADAVVAAQNKYLFRERLSACGLPVPGYRLLPVTTCAEIEAACQRFPCVLKPLSLAASRGVIRADDEAEFVAGFKRLAAILALPDARQPGQAGRHILVEDYIPGTEVAVEGLLDEGRLTILAIFDKPDQSDGPFFEETIYVTPSGLPAELQATVSATVQEAVAALGLRQGPIHAEVRANDDGAWMIELDARTLGGHCARSLRFGHETRLEDIVLRHAMGLPIETLERERESSGLMMIPIPCRGVLRGVKGVEAAKTVPGVRDLLVSIPVGQDVVPPPEGGRYLGFIFTAGKTREEALAALRAAHAALEFDIEAVVAGEGVTQPPQLHGRLRPDPRVSRTPTPPGH